MREAQPPDRAQGGGATHEPLLPERTQEKAEVWRLFGYGLTAKEIAQDTGLELVLVRRILARWRL